LTAEQLTLSWEHRPALGVDDFLISPCNERAVAKIDAFPDWSSPALILVGAEGCGKTHLLRVFQSMHGGTVVAPDNLVPEHISELPESEAFLIEDVAKWIGIKAHEEALFHLYNRCFASGEKLLISSRTFPNHWDTLTPDLASRLKSADVAEIGPPDDTLLMALLAKHFADRQVRVAPGVIEYVTPRIERSFAAVQSFAAAADAKALKDKRQITIPLARDVLSANE
jgi:chromosomal replication initiation ATPase DnaA